MDAATACPTSPIDDLETAITETEGAMAALNSLHGQLAQYDPINREQLTDALVYLLGHLGTHLTDVRTHFDAVWDAEKQRVEQLSRPRAQGGP